MSGVSGKSSSKWPGNAERNCDEHLSAIPVSRGPLFDLVLSFFRDGSGCLCTEPSADSATDARGQTQRESIARIPGEHGEFSLDDFRWQHVGELCRGQPGGFCPASIVWAGAASGNAAAGAGRSGVLILCVLRSLAEDAVSALSQPALPGAGNPFSFHSLRACAAGVTDGLDCQGAASLEWW